MLRSCPGRSIGLLVLLVLSAVAASAETIVTLQSQTSPSAGQAGIHTINVTGSGFPTGTISPGAVIVRLDPTTAGSGPSTSTPALSIVTIFGSTRRVSFRIPTSTLVSAPTAYRVSLSGSTTTGLTFSTGNSAGLTVNPPPSVTISPEAGDAGQNVSVVITGSFTNFVQGTTMASFGTGTSVGGAADGGFGLVTVTSPTSATASVAIAGGAVAGDRTVTVKTGVQQAIAEFTVVPTTPPPTIAAAVDPPPNAAGWHMSDPTVSFLCTNATECPAAVTVMTEGAGQIVERTAIGPGGTATASATINLDKTAPAVTIASPADGAMVSSSPVTVSGSVIESLSGLDTLLCNAVPAVQNAGSFTCDVPLNEGDNVIVVAARDRAGNLGTRQIGVRLETDVADVTPPQLAIGSPAPGAFVFQDKPPVDLTYSDPSGVDLATLTLSANGMALIIDCSLSPSGGRCTPTTPLPNGNVKLAARVRDTLGNEALREVSFTIDSAPVEVEITSPADRLITGVGSIQVTGTAGDDVISVGVNGVDATLAGGSFSATVPLRGGVNMLVAVATKANGKTGTDSIDVTRDNIAPIVRIDSPRDGLISANNALPVTGLVNDIVSGALNAQVVVNGTPAVVGDGTFMVTELALVRGPNVIEAVARDFAGNEGRHSVTVHFQPPVGARLAILSGNGQSALVRQGLPQPLVAVVRDDVGNPVAGRVVRFEVTRNNAALRLGQSDAGQREIQVPTDGSGRASVLLTLGDTAGQGNNRVTVTSVGVTGEIEFCASGLTAPPQKILMTNGDNQRGVVGHPLATPLEALVVDRDGNPVKQLAVTFAVTRGGGHIDGEASVQRMTGTDGVARAVLTLGPDAGIANNLVAASFAGLTGLPATFTASALVPGNPAETGFKGVVLDNGHTPIPFAKVTIEADPPVVGETDEQGQFVLNNVPVGKVHLMIEPLDPDNPRSLRPETFPPLAFETVTIAGQMNVLGQPILIPALDTDNSKIVGGPTDVTLTMNGVAGLELTVFANSVTCKDGSKQCRVTISQVHLDKVPMPPPSGTVFMPPAWTVQPAGTHFNPPARIQIPNDGMPPGRIIDIFQFDHDLNTFINIGKGTTSADGLVIVSDPGFGITAAGWGGCGQPQPPTTCAGGCDDKNPCTDDKCENGSCVYTNKADGAACEAGEDRAFTDNGVTVNINKNCSKGTCKSGACSPKSDRWGLDAMETATKDAIGKIFGTCIGDDNGLRTAMQDNLKKKGFKISCLDSGDSNGNGNDDCASAALNDNKLDFSNLGVSDCGSVAKSVRHEMQHAVGGRDHTASAADDTVYACDLACYGSSNKAGASAANCK